MNIDYAIHEHDYLTPTRSQYWRTTGVRAGSPAVGVRRSVTPSWDTYRAPIRAVPTASTSYDATPDYDRYKAPSPYVRKEALYRAVEATPDYVPTPRRSVYGAYGSPASERGRSPSPRGSPPYALPTAHAYGHESAAPPRPHLTSARTTAPSSDSTSRWAPVPQPARYEDVRLRAQSPGVSARVSASATRPGRSPSMVKDPCTTFLPPAHPHASHRLCLALDLDETLVYAREGPIQVRPFARDLLRALHDMDVEVIVWTAGERDYAQSVIKTLDPLGTVQHCVYRHPKWWTGQAGYTKNLRALGRNLARTLLVDNTPDCLRDQPDNGLLISDFEGRASYDDCLRSLLHVVSDIVDRPFESVPRVLAESNDVVRRSVPLDAGGRVSVWTLACDQAVTQPSYQQVHINRDSPLRSRSRGRW
jgi:RNA polymerase II subunit A small phosphatase-like protein